jgi:hypothetical protein
MHVHTLEKLNVIVSSAWFACRCEQAAVKSLAGLKFLRQVSSLQQLVAGDVGASIEQCSLQQSMIFVKRSRAREPYVVLRH